LRAPPPFPPADLERVELAVPQEQGRVFDVEGLGQVAGEQGNEGLEVRGLQGAIREPPEGGGVGREAALV